MRQEQGKIMECAENDFIDLASRIEKQLGKPLAEISSKSQDLVEFKGERLKLDTLFTRLARLCNSRSRSIGRTLLIEIARYGDLDTAIRNIIKKEAEKTADPQPISIDLITTDTLRKMEKILGKRMTDLRKNDNEQQTIQIGDAFYSFSPRTLLRRITESGDPMSISQARNFLSLLAEGMDRRTAAERVGIKIDFTSNSPKGSLDDKTLKEIAQSLEEQLGHNINKLTSKTVVDVEIETKQFIFKGRLRSLLENAGRQLQCTRGEVLTRMKQLVSRDHEGDTTRLILDKEFFDEVLSPEGIESLEAVLGFSITGSSTKDFTEVEYKSSGYTYRFRYRQFLEATARVYLGDKGKRGIARTFLELVKKGGNIEKAKAQCQFIEEDDIDDKLERLSQLKLEEAIALLRNDPLKLKLYLQFAHPELSEEFIDHLIIRSFKGLVSGPNDTKETEYLSWNTELLDVKLETKVPQETEERTLTIAGKASGANSVYVAGSWNRRVRVEPDGTFSIALPLRIGGKNEIRIMALHREAKVRSKQKSFIVMQEGESDDVEALISLLSQLQKELLEGIQKDPGRMQFFIACTEKALIKKFGRSFELGKEHIERLIASSESPTIKSVLGAVLKNFEGVNRMKLSNVQEGSLMFFQKYCVHAIRKKMAEGASGVVLANDPGLGKTRTILAALSEDEAAIFTPNSVVSTWDEEAGEVLMDPALLVMRDIPHATRKELLKNGDHLRIVTNIQFLRNTNDAERFALLSNEDTVVVHDEAHSRANEQSEQSKGAKMLQHRFQINVSATPFKNPKTLRRILAILEPNDLRFQSDAAFNTAFPSRDPQALKALSLLKDKYTIRFRKQDVMEEIDPNTLLSQQTHRLPRKEYVPPETLGQFEMSKQQAEAIYELFLNWEKWCRKYDKYIPKDEVAQEDRLRTAEGLTKRHALRQIVNNPSYIGARAEDAKTLQIQRIVSKCLKEGRKVVIFCAYNAQALKYGEIFKKYHPALYAGITSEEGLKKDSKGNPLTFAREKTESKKRGWIFDAKGYPKQDPNGETMPALDYERLTFQNAYDRKIIIATYQAGAVGTTFTAGKALILDDLPVDITEALQAEDRIHRIDPNHQTHASVQYFSMQSKYPERFLEKMKRRWVAKQFDGTYAEYRTKAAAIASEGSDANVQTAYDAFFAQGTYDQVQFRNLQVQKQMFHLINDGIADESILKEVKALDI